MGKKRKCSGSSPPPSSIKKRRPLVIPTSDVVHTQTTKEGRRDFYDGVQMDVPKEHYDSDYANDVPSKWTVSVGDLVAVHCTETHAPEKKIYSRKSIWYPFNKPWSPGQIVSIYQDFKLKGRKGGEDMQMQIRWLYRRQDLITEDNEFQQKLKCSEHGWRMVYETDAIDEYDVNATLGKILLTTYPHSALQGTYQDPKTLIPQMTHVCQSRVGKNDVMEKVLDWDHYNDWSPKYKLPAPLLRGLNCPKSHSHKDKALMNAHIYAIYDRWKEESNREKQANVLNMNDAGIAETARESGAADAASVEAPSNQKQGAAATSSKRTSRESSAADAEAKMPARKSLRSAAARDETVNLTVSASPGESSDKAVGLKTDKSDSVSARAPPTAEQAETATVDLTPLPKQAESTSDEGTKDGKQHPPEEETDEPDFTPFSMRSAGGGGYLRKCTPRQFAETSQILQQRATAKSAAKTSPSTKKTRGKTSEKPSAKLKVAVGTKDKKPQRTGASSNQETAETKSAKSVKNAATRRRAAASRPVPLFEGTPAAFNLANSPRARICSPTRRGISPEDLRLIRRARLSMSPTLHTEISRPASEKQSKKSKLPSDSSKSDTHKRARASSRSTDSERPTVNFSDSNVTSGTAAAEVSEEASVEPRKDLLKEIVDSKSEDKRKKVECDGEPEEDLKPAASEKTPDGVSGIDEGRKTRRKRKASDSKRVIDKKKPTKVRNEESPAEDSDDDSVVINVANKLHSKETKTKRREYFKSVQVRVRADECAPRVLPKKASEKQLWTLSVGDVVCVECEESHPQADHILQQNKHRNSKEACQWYPFVTPWSPCQILSIYRELDFRDGENDVGEVLLEIRWFYRKSDLQKSMEGLLPFKLDEHIEEVFETDHIERDCPASAVLGHAELLLGNTNEISNPRKEGAKSAQVPTVQCRCRLFIPAHQDEVATIPQPLFYANTEPNICFKKMVARCLQISDLMGKDRKLKRSTAALLNSSLGLSGHDARSSPLPFSSQPMATPLPEIKDVGREYFKSVSIPPPWDNFHFDDLMWPPEDRRRDQLWTVRVGDVVAMHLNDSTNPTHGENKETKWYPYSVPWSPCQVLAIFRNVPEKRRDENSSSSTPGEATSVDFMVEVRWLFRQKDLPEGAKVPDRWQSRSKELKMELLFESDYVETEAKDVASLLGPVHLVSLHIMRDGIESLLSNAPPFMPVVLQMYGGECSRNKKGLKCHDKLSMQGALERGIRYSTHYRTKKRQKKVLELLLENDEEKEEDASAFAAELVNEDLEASGIPVEEGRTQDASKLGNDRQIRQSKRSNESPSFPASSTSPNPAASEYERVVQDFISEDSAVETSAAFVPKGDATEEQEENDVESTQSILSTSLEKRVGLKDPYHVDMSSMTSFYKEVYVAPPYTNYAHGLVVGGEKKINGEDESDGELWKVKMGDVVIVHSDDEGRKTEKSSTFPFNVPWSVGEVVTIFRTHSSTAEMPDPGSVAKSIHFPKDQDSIKTEVRWLYRKCQLPGSAPCMSTMNQVDDEYEEVLETDAVDETSALSLLAPAKLHEEANNIGTSESFLRMPVLDFHCRRFWSIHRKSLLPCGTMIGMKERGRMHSQYFGKNQVLRAAIESPEREVERSVDVADTVEAGQATTSHRDAFREVIMKLSLIDASEATNVRGLRLTGREKEQSRLMSFLRSAIRSEPCSGDDDADQRKSSMFVAGPPGTGKTASVRSAVERLRHEQARGDIPEFEFIYLNGMEMRHPFEAYEKLWEALSGTKKEKLSPGAAAAELEKHFAQNSGNHRGKRRITVLMLDEIDYLVTRKQTVLYNFFDWPIRTAKNGNGPRLIVVGISNTVNLPERLKPSVQSRLGGQRCDFGSYKVDEMVKILKMKIDLDDTSAPPVFDQDAILFAARKTAASSGDVRKALQICKSAAEVVLGELEDGKRDGPSMVRIRDVQKVSREANSSVLSKAVSLSTPFEALLLVSLASLTRTSGRGNGRFDIKEVMTKLESVAAGSGDLQYMPPPSFGETLDMLNRLGAARLVTLHTPKSSITQFRAAQGGSGGAWPLISLPMEDSNILTALRDTPHGELAEKYLGRARL